MKSSNSKEQEPVKVLIVDDESLGRKRIRDLLANRKEFEIIGDCSCGEEAVDAIKSGDSDLVFLDIQMQDMDGFQVLEKVRSGNLPIIIFVTAYDQYALKAFEVHALDYLLKPFDDERFEEALEHVYKKIKKDRIHVLGDKITSLLTDLKEFDGGNGSRGASKNPANAYQKRLVIKSTGKVSFIEVKDIDWIGADGSYVNINARGKSQLMRGTLKSLESKLDPEKFLRIHRSTIVNIAAVKELKSHFHGEYVVILKNGERLKLSRSYRDNAKLLLNG
ncbi:MAG: response regulator transcription factor [Pyrinomonadaceae bacterium]|nr:response regulator transcription factor [Pyrinomonadaceae bacterium]